MRKSSIWSKKSKRNSKSNMKSSDVDGVRVLFPDGWGLFFEHRTRGPVLVLRFEAQSEQRLQEIRSMMESTLGKNESDAVIDSKENS